MGSKLFHFQNPAVLGTVVDVTIAAADNRVADRAAVILFDEIDRLQAVFSVFDSESELSRWRGAAEPSGQPHSVEFGRLMDHAARWQSLTDGLFNPLIGELTDRWEASESAGAVPEAAELRYLADTIIEPRFEIVDGQPIRFGDCSRFNLNALAKGFIVDCAVAAVGRDVEVEELLVNAGGDLRHRGGDTVRVGVENPLLPFDNEPPLTVIEIENEAVATSGSGRRGFTVDGRAYSHIIDPRTGQPATGAAGVTVVARSAMVADVVATAVVILKPDEGMDLVERLNETEPLAALIVDHDQGIHPSTGWSQRFS